MTSLFLFFRLPFLLLSLSPRSQKKKKKTPQNHSPHAALWLFRRGLGRGLRLPARGIRLRDLQEEERPRRRRRQPRRLHRGRDPVGTPRRHALPQRAGALRARRRALRAHARRRRLRLQVRVLGGRREGRVQVEVCQDAVSILSLFFSFTSPMIFVRPFYRSAPLSLSARFLLLPIR